jgi:hypothetical protein
MKIMTNNAEMQEISTTERLITTEAVSGIVATVTGLFAVESFLANNPDWRPEAVLAGVFAATCLAADTARRRQKL